MRSEHQTQLESRRLKQIAKEYEQQGYTVTLYPSASVLPVPLQTCPFGLIAQSDAKTIAVEVRNRDNLTLNGSEDLRQMAELVKQVPGWEFELVVTNPRKPEA